MRSILMCGGVFTLVLLLSACGGKQSAVEGKLVDWNGKPVAGAKVTASQVQPLKGYEQFEAATNSDGTFRVSGLFPSSLYVLKPSAEKWICETAVQVNSAPQGETAVLPSPMVINNVFTKSDSLVVADIATGAVGQASVQGTLLWSGGKVIEAVPLPPVEGVKIIAVPQQPIKGHEQCEAVTASDGTFRLSSLVPSSTYRLFPRSDKWITETEVSINTPPRHGDIAGLQQPIMIAKAFSMGGSLVTDLATGATRFTLTSEGAIADSETGLEWVVGPDRDTNYAQAEQWVSACNVAGGGWRIPTMEEFQALYLKGIGERGMDSVFKATGGRVWGKERGSSSSGPFDKSVGAFGYGGGYTYYREDSSGNRVFGVRSRPPMVSSEGTITDPKTALQWVVGPDQDTNYAQAEQWVAACKVAGGGWRMPTRAELKTLYQKGLGERNMDPSFKTTGFWVWTEPKDSSSSWVFNFTGGFEDSYRRDLSYSFRVFGVRSHPSKDPVPVPAPAPGAALGGSHGTPLAGNHGAASTSSPGGNAPAASAAQGATQFTLSSEGVIADSKTGLEWVVGQDRNTNYEQAEQWVASCKVAGGGWRMPTRQELQSLYQPRGDDRHMDPSFKTTGCWVWAEPKDSSAAWCFSFRDGNEFAGNRDRSNSLRVFGVRSRKDPAPVSAPAAGVAPGESHGMNAPMKGGINMPEGTPTFLDGWAKMVQMKVEKIWQPPADVNVSGVDDKALVSFWVDREGNLIGKPEIMKHASDAQLGESGLRAILEVVPLPPLPEDFTLKKAVEPHSSVLSTSIL